MKCDVCKESKGYLVVCDANFTKAIYSKEKAKR